VAVGDGGVYTGPAAVLIYLSNNGGSTFVPATQTLPQNDYGPVATPTAGVIILASGLGSLMGSFDGGRTWTPVYGSPTSEGWLYPGFTTATQVVAIDGSGTLVMTFDGGHHWGPVTIPTDASR
jgi:photosystem II stability/assembly factor-like uncharacterized protein